MFFEQAREQSEKEYQDNPEDAHVRIVHAVPLLAAC